MLVVHSRAQHALLDWLISRCGANLPAPRESKEASLFSAKKVRLFDFAASSLRLLPHAVSTVHSLSLDLLLVVQKAMRSFVLSTLAKQVSNVGRSVRFGEHPDAFLLAHLLRYALQGVTRARSLYFSVRIELTERLNLHILSFRGEPQNLVRLASSLFTEGKYTGTPYS